MNEIDESKLEDKTVILLLPQDYFLVRFSDAAQKVLL